MASKVKENELLDFELITVINDVEYYQKYIKVLIKVNNPLINTFININSDVEITLTLTVAHDLLNKNYHVSLVDMMNKFQSFGPFKDKIELLNLIKSYIDKIPNKI